MLKQKSDSLVAVISAVFFIVLVIYLLTRDVSLVGPI
jgi:hypothetical protein